MDELAPFVGLGVVVLGLVGAGLFAEADSLGIPTRCAIVAPEDAVYGVSRMWQLMREDYTHAAILEFEDLAGLRAYLEHPAHTDLGSRFFECFEQALMYDFDVQDGHAGLNALIEEET